MSIKLGDKVKVTNFYYNRELINMSGKVLHLIHDTDCIYNQSKWATVLFNDNKTYTIPIQFLIEEYDNEKQ